MAVQPTWSMLSVLLAAAMLLAGMIFIWLGYRGRRVDDHPICRGCGYDLVGRPEGSERCSECGADLSDPRAIRIGRRKARRGMLLSGVMLLLLGGLGVGLIAVQAAGNFNPNQYKPAWWLLSDARSTAPTTRDPALAELVNRLKSGRLSDGNMLKLADLALAVQGDSSKPWVPVFGDAVEWIHAAGKLPADKWQRYVSQAVTVIMDTRPKVRLGAAIPVRVRNDARMSTAGRLYLVTGRSRTEISGHECDKSRRSGGGASSLSNGSGGASWWTIEPEDEGLKGMKPGQQELRLRMDVSVYDAQPPSWDPKSKAQPVAQREVDLRTPFELVAGETVKVVQDETLRAGVEKDIKVKIKRDQSTYISAEVNVQSPPVSLAYDVIVRDGQKKEWRIGSVAFLPGKGAGWYTSGSADGFNATKCDVILRPSKTAAEGQVELIEMWDGEILLKDVAVEERK